MTVKWSEITLDGKRLETLIKMCKSQIKHEIKRAKEAKDDVDYVRVWGYLDRLVKLTHEKLIISDRVLGVKEVLRKKENNVIIP